MQYRSDLIPRPVRMTHAAVGTRLPSVTASRVPFGQNKRLISIERRAPQNGYEAINGLGVIDNTNVKGFKIDGRLDRRMLYPVITKIQNNPIPLFPQPIRKVGNGPAFVNLSLQGLGDEPGAEYNAPPTAAGPVPGANDAGFWSSLSSALASTQVNALVNAGAKFYVQDAATKSAMSVTGAQAQTAAMKAQVAKQNAQIAAAAGGGTPSWVLPVVAVGGIGLVALFFLRK